MKKLIFILGFLLFATAANAACPAGTYYTTNGTNCIFVSPTNPLPVAASITPSGLQDVNITKIQGAAPSLTNPLWVFPATGATFPISGTVSATQSGTWTVQPGNTANTTAWLVTGTGGTFPVTGTFWQATQPISAASLPLPTLAATSTKQSDGSQKTQIVDGSGNVVGATSNALDVNIKSGFGTTIAVTQSTSPWVVSNGGTFAVQVTGSVTANAGTNLNTSLLALESGGNLATLAGGVSASVYQHNTKQINGVVPLMGNGVTGTGSQRVTIASDNTAFSVNATLSAETTKVIGTVNVASGQTIGLSAGSAVIGHIICDSGCSSSTAPADESAFTFGTTSQSPVGGVYQTTATSNALTTGQMGAFQVTANRALFVNLRNASGAELGVAAAPVQVSLANTGANSNKLLVTPDSVALPANQSVNVSQINAVTPLMGNGVTGTGSQRVTIASDNTAFSVNATLAAETTKVIGTVNQGTSPWVVAATLSAETTKIIGTVNQAPVTKVSSSALAANLVINAAAGNLYSFEIAADSTLSAAAWWVMIYDATSAPGDGAVTPAKCYPMPLGATSYSAAWPNPAAFGTGIVIGVSTTGCFTKTASTHAFISGDYK